MIFLWYFYYFLISNGHSEESVAQKKKLFVIFFIISDNHRYKSKKAVAAFFNIIMRENNLIEKKVNPEGLLFYRQFKQKAEEEEEYLETIIEGEKIYDEADVCTKDLLHKNTEDTSFKIKSLSGKIGRGSGLLVSPNFVLATASAISKIATTSAVLVMKNMSK